MVGFVGVQAVQSVVESNDTTITVPISVDTASILVKEPTFIIEKPPVKGDYQDFKHKVAMIESRGSYSARSTIYWGRYQFDHNARKATGVGDLNWEEYSTSPRKQDAAFKKWVKLMHKSMKKDIAKYDGMFVGQYQLSESSIIALAHNMGVGGAHKYLQKHSTTTPRNIPVNKFLKLNGYDLSEVLCSNSIKSDSL